MSSKPESKFNHTKSELKPGVWFSPGFYAAYWDEHINKLFTPQEIIERVELKQHREVWVGAIFAASQSLSGVPHFVGLPQQEPPDVEVIKFTEMFTPKGTPSTKLTRISLEITRCNRDVGETLLGQIKNKNKPAYTGNHLLIYEYGKRVANSYNVVFEKLQKEKIFPESVIVVAKIDHTDGGIVLPDGTFAVTMLYPKKGQTLVNIADLNAFFRYPEVVQSSGLATGVDWQNKGSYELLAPKLKRRAK